MTGKPLYTPLFLTGATGFLGRALLPALLEAGWAVRVLVRPQSLPCLQQRLADHPQREAVTPIVGGLEQPAAYRDALAGCAAVVHAAGLFRFWGPREAFERINHQGTLCLAEAAVQAGVRRFVHISTLAVIGRPPAGEVITEATPCRPLDPYQRSKYAAEQSLLRLAGQTGLEVVILRPGGFYGPGGTYGLNRLLILDPLRGLRIQVKGGRMHLFPPVHIADAAQGVLAALERGRPGEIYHLHDDPPTLAEANRLVSRLAGISPFRLNVPVPLILAFAALLEGLSRLTGREPLYPLNLRHYVFPDWQASNAKARRELGFTPTPLEEGLQETIAWAKAYLRSNASGMR